MIFDFVEEWFELVFNVKNVVNDMDFWSRGVRFGNVFY